MKLNKLDIWLIAGWVIFLVFVAVDIMLVVHGTYVSTTLEVLVGTVFGAFETVCCTVIKTNEQKEAYKYELEKVRLTGELSNKNKKTDNDDFDDHTVDGDRGY